MSEPRKIEVTIEENFYLSEHASVVKIQDGTIAGYAESKRNGLQVDADQVGHDSILGNLKGVSPAGESETMYVCRVLVEALNSQGGGWGEVSPGRDEVDGSAKCVKDSGNELRIQVIRADPTPERWKQLADDGAVHISCRAEELAYPILESIRRKSVGYPISIKAGITLALDATRIPAMTLTVARTRIRELTRHDCIASGFKSVWVVGPTHELTYSLIE
jgi:hypothetical protein